MREIIPCSDRPADMAQPYTVILIADSHGSDGGYSAEVLELPGCFADGDTANEAMHHIQAAIESWIAAARAMGQTIPPPMVLQGYHGRVALRLPRSLHRRAALLAQRDGVSLNQWLVAAIAVAGGEKG